MPRRSSSESKSRGFTMIELVVVMVILALLASLTVYSLGGVMDQYQLSQAIQTIERFDARARREARRGSQPLKATLDRTRGRLSFQTASALDPVRYRLPRRVAIREIRVAGRASIGGSFDLAMNRFGQSPAYAIHLQRGNTNRWLVVLGLTGQVIALDTKREADAILSL